VAGTVVAMMRHCDGADPNLLREVPCPDPINCEDGTCHRNGAVKGATRSHWLPCDCGAVFNDVSAMVIYPHVRF
jgi:hypothetical protein